MNNEGKARLKQGLKQGLMVGGVTLAGLMVVQGISPCMLMQRCGPPGRVKSEACATANSASPSDVLVTVNGKPITRAEVDGELQAALGSRIERMSAREREAVRAQWTPRVL
jgi:hypothetical protein